MTPVAVGVGRRLRLATEMLVVSPSSVTVTVLVMRTVAVFASEMVVVSVSYSVEPRSMMFHSVCVTVAFPDLVSVRVVVRVIVVLDVRLASGLNSAWDYSLRVDTGSISAAFLILLTALVNSISKCSSQVPCCGKNLQNHLVHLFHNTAGCPSNIRSPDLYSRWHPRHSSNPYNR